jgi:hypothetical protein
MEVDMKPRQVADVIGFVSYYYAVNGHLPQRDLWKLAFRQNNLDTARANGHANRGLNIGRGTVAGLDAVTERQEEHHSPAA